MLVVEFFAVHTVQEEIQQVQNNSLSSLVFDYADYIVVGCRVIFDKYLSHNAHFGFFDIP